MTEDLLPTNFELLRTYTVPKPPAIKTLTPIQRELVASMIATADHYSARNLDFPKTAWMIHQLEQILL